jgi:glycosyltransferase involved in cell wall biosynthesis
MIKITIVMPSAQPKGGAEEALLQLVKHRDVAEVYLISVIFLEEGALTEVVANFGIDVHVIRAGRLREPRKAWRCVKQLSTLFKGNRPDLVLGWMTKAHIYSGVAAWLADVPAVYFQMGTPDGGWVDRLSRLIPATGALACSEYAATLQQSKTRVPVHGVALGADLERFAPQRLPSPMEIRVSKGLPLDRPIIGIVSRLQHWKGVHVFVSAMIEVIKINPLCLGVIVGGAHDLEPEYEDALRRQIESAGLTEQILMVGKQTDVPEWMQVMDVVVHASFQEPFGIVVVEAMALGKPIIATRPGGPDEIITHEENGLLVPWNEPQRLASEMIRLLEDSSLKKRLTTQAIIRSQEFSAAMYAKRTGHALHCLLHTQHCSPQS